VEQGYADPQERVASGSSVEGRREGQRTGVDAATRRVQARFQAQFRPITINLLSFDGYCGMHVSGCLLAGFQGASRGVVGVHAVVGLAQRHHLGRWLTVQLAHADQQV